MQTIQKFEMVEIGNGFGIMNPHCGPSFGWKGVKLEWSIRWTETNNRADTHIAGRTFGVSTPPD